LEAKNCFKPVICHGTIDDLQVMRYVR